MLGRTNTGGGGGGLNFSVIGSSTVPSGAKENMIWVNTSTPITSWIFSATEPASPAEGMAWINIGTSSPVAFNALKKNGIQVYPVSAKQYVSGEWVDVTAKSYQGGEWVGWMYRLYVAGMRDVFTTVAWQSESSQIAYEPTVTYSTNGATIKVNSEIGGRTGIAYFDAIDLTQYATIEADLVVAEVKTNEYPKANGLFVWDSVTVSGYYPDKAKAKYQFTDNGEQTVLLDISSLYGNHYIGFGLRRSDEASILVKQVRLLP